MIFARHARANVDLGRTAVVVILLANIVVMVRIAVVSFAVAP
jgi:hypothetical protein